MQTLNGLVDALEDLIERCVPPSHYSFIYNDNDNDNDNDDSRGGGGGTRKKEKKYKSGASLPELKSHYEIEFMLPGGRDDDRDAEGLKKKHGRNRREPLTMRSITVEFPKELRRDVKKWALSTPASFPPSSGITDGRFSRREEEAFAVAMQLRQHAVYEFGRLLKIAGMEFATHRSEDPYSKSGSDGDGVGWGNMRQRLRRQQLKQPRRRKEEWTLTDHFLHELGFDPTEEDDRESERHSRMTNESSSSSPSPRSAFFGRGQKYTPPSSASSASTTSPFYSAFSSSISPNETTAPPPPAYSHPKLREQRQKFINSVNWSAFRDSYDQAFLDAKADFDTMKMNLYNIHTQEGRERREKLVSDICGGVRVWTPLTGRRRNGEDDREERDGDDEDENDDDDRDESDIPEGLDVVQQLIALRRLSMILYDNFDYLQMEEMGRMWEQLVIVLTPPRSWRRRRRLNVGSDSSGSYDDDSDRIRRSRRKLTKWERNRKKREKLQSSANRDVMRYFAVNHGRLTKKMSMSDASGSDTNDDYIRRRDQGDQDPDDDDLTSRDDDGIDGNNNDDNNTSNNKNNNNNNNEYTTTYPESGFKFSYGTTADQGTGQVTAYIPIDFGDEELVRMLYTHLYDYFDTCCGDVGFLTLDGTGNVVANGARYHGDGGVRIKGIQDL